MISKIRPLIKYIGSKQAMADEIITYFPVIEGTYFEPFLGSAAVLGHLCPERAIASDANQVLIEMWQLAKINPSELSDSYRMHMENLAKCDKKTYYEKIRTRFNACPNACDFLFISRACYGGVIRYRQDGYLSTPVGSHTPISADAFDLRLELWKQVISHTEFHHYDFKEAMCLAKQGDLVYCDPPYVDSQKIIYGAQKFDLASLFQVLLEAKSRGVTVVVSVDGTKRCGDNIIINVPDGLFETEVFLSKGGSMLKRFSRGGGDVVDEVVTDRLLLSYVAPEPIMSSIIIQ